MFGTLTLASTIAAIGTDIAPEFAGVVLIVGGFGVTKMLQRVFKRFGFRG